MTKPKFKLSIEVSCRTKVPHYYKDLVRQMARRSLFHIPGAVSRQRQPWTLSVCFVDQPRMKALNRQFRMKNKVTDVLSFPRVAQKGVSGDLGDIVICWPQAKRQAKAYGTPAASELRRLIAHGVLHLFGYDHERSKLQARKMFSLQEEILEKEYP
ncbi:MAG: rRNA maturation RNase YbeY [Deltaproteobacteria bacterium]|nr:rRNA maturation RNase YbeY [Deltaproteobacteria bacterium]